MGSPCFQWGSSWAGGSDDLTACLGIDRSPRGCFHQASWPQQTRLLYTVASEQCPTWIKSKAAKPPEGRLWNPTLQHHFWNILLVKAHDRSQGPRGNTPHLFGGCKSPWSRLSISYNSTPHCLVTTAWAHSPVPTGVSRLCFCT